MPAWMTGILRHSMKCLITRFACNIYSSRLLCHIYDWCARAGNLYKHITLLCLYFIDIPSCMTVFLKTIYHINKKYSNKTLSNVRVYMRKLCMIFWMWTNGMTMSNQYLQNYEVYSGWQFSCGGAHVRGISVTWNGLSWSGGHDECEPCWVELGVHSTSVLSSTWTKKIKPRGVHDVCVTIMGTVFWSFWYITVQKVSIHQLTNDARVIIIVSGHQHRWLAGGYDLEIGHFNRGK